MFRQLAIGKKALEEIGILWLFMAPDPILEMAYLDVSAETLFEVAFIVLFLGMCSMAWSIKCLTMLLRFMRWLECFCDHAPNHFISPPTQL